MTITRTRPRDTEAEQRVAALLAEHWRVHVTRQAYFDTFDWWLNRDGRPVAAAEFKSRTHPSTQYPTVYLAYHKWHHLLLATLTGRAALFIVEFTDGVRWIDVRDINPRNLTFAGRWDREGMPNDYEPIIEVPVDTMLGIGSAP